MEDKQKQQLATARLAGIFYLLLAITGVLGFLVFHSQVFDVDPQKTLTNLVEKESYARTRLLLEFGIIISQALTAVWFYKLFKEVKEWAAVATLIWGTVNAVVIMISAISMGAALGVAQSSMLLDDQVVVIDLLNKIISNSWAVGSLFFGLWLIPLGYIVTSSKRLPVWLGRVLILGGIGYVLSAFVSYAGFSGTWVETLTIPASVGEFWMIGYLFIFGIRPENE